MKQSKRKVAKYLAAMTLVIFALVIWRCCPSPRPPAADCAEKSRTPAAGETIDPAPPASVAVVWCHSNLAKADIPIMFVRSQVLVLPAPEAGGTPNQNALGGTLQALLRGRCVRGKPSADIGVREPPRTTDGEGVERAQPWTVAGLDDVRLAECMQDLRGSRGALTTLAVGGASYRFAIDLNYVHGSTPGWQFKPDGVAKVATVAVRTGANKAASTTKVLVLDTGYPQSSAPGLLTDGSTELYDPITNLATALTSAQVQRHGAFITDLIGRTFALTTRPTIALANVMSSLVRPYFTESELIAAIDRTFGLGQQSGAPRFGVTAGALGVGAAVVNMSFGSDALDTPGAGHRTLATELALLLSKGGWANPASVSPPVIVAAAGNSGSAAKFYPAAFATEATLGSTADALKLGASDISAAVVSVGAGTATSPASYSNRGNWVTTWANGACRASVPSPAGAWEWSGTSFAAANVATAIASWPSATGGPNTAYNDLLTDPARRKTIAGLSTNCS